MGLRSQPMLSADLPELPRISATPALRITKAEPLPLLFRQLRVDARGLEELIVGVGDGRVSVRAVAGAGAVEIRATVLCDDPDALEELVRSDLGDRLQIIVDRPSTSLARLLVALDPSDGADLDALHLDVEITVPEATTLALDHAAEV
ncbi:MAG: hypothetical protein R3A79_22335 [Nannocystaceae bacterium]